MSDIPDEFMKAAQGCLAGFTLRQQIAYVACALMAADEAATKRERERCAAIAQDLQYSADAAFNRRVLRSRKGEKNLELAAATAAGMSHQARKAAAAILKGEA